MSVKTKIVSGRNIFKDDKGRDILYIKSKNTGYVIQEKDQKGYNLYSNRYVISVIAGVLAANFNIPVLYCIAISVALIAFLEYRYRTHFLPSLIQLTNFKPTKNISTLDALILEKDKKRNLTLAILYVALGVLIVINGIQMKVSPIIMIGNIIVCIAALYMGIMNFIAFTKIKP